MNPTINDVKPVDPILTNVALQYMQNDARFIADKVFPGVPVDTDSGTYFTFDKKYWLSDEMVPRAPGQKYPRGIFNMGTDTYTTYQWALAKDIADEVDASNRSPMNLRQAATRWLASKALIRKERLWAAAFMTTSVWGTDKTDATKWSTTDTSDPIKDVGLGRRTMSQATGFEPNVMIMGEIVLDRLIEHPDMAGKIQYVKAATAANIRAALAELFQIEQILVGKAIYNSANEGQSASVSPIIDDDCLLLHVTSAPSIEEPSAGYGFHWAPGGGLGSIRPPYRDEEAETDLVRFKMQLTYKKVAADLGYFFSDITD